MRSNNIFFMTTIIFGFICDAVIVVGSIYDPNLCNGIILIWLMVHSFSIFVNIWEMCLYYAYVQQQQNQLFYDWLDDYHDWYKSAAIVRDVCKVVSIIVCAMTHFLETCAEHDGLERWIFIYAVGGTVLLISQCGIDGFEGRHVFKCFRCHAVVRPSIQIPHENYGTIIPVDEHEQTSDKGSVNKQDCAICIESGSGESIMINCGNNHVYHVKCIDEWIRIKGEGVCPMCRGRF